MNMEKPMLTSKIQSGFTLIETLVSLVIISVGILAFALLQAESLRTTHISMQRTKAIHFATDILERMQANRAGIPAYKFAAPLGAEPSNCSDAEGAAAVDCTSFQLARFDLWEWNRAIQNDRAGIVGGTGTISVLPAGAATFAVSIVIEWNDRDTTSSYTLDTIL